MVDHSTREVNVAELANKVEELRRKVCELDTRVINTPPPTRLVPRMVNEDAERDRLAKIEHLEMELGGIRTDRDHFKKLSEERLDAVAALHSDLASLRNRLLKSHLEGAGMDEALTDANVKIEDYSKRLGEALLERDNYKAMAVDRRHTVEILRAQVR